MSTPRRAFNSVGHPMLPDKPDVLEIARWLRDKAVWEELQPSGREMDARVWAATCLTCAAEELERTHPQSPTQGERDKGGGE
jgi:hypothetical protein